MKSTKIYILLIFAFLFSVSCKKKEIEIPASNAPVFSASGTFDGEAFDLVAGDNGVYMHTMTKLENGVKVFSGVISNNDFSFEFGAFDGNLDVQPSAIQASNIAPIFSSISTTPIAILSKSVFQNASNINYIKWFVDGVDRGMNDVSIYEAGKYTICAEIHFNDGLEKTLCNDLILGFNHNATSSFNTEMNGNGLVKISIENTSHQIVTIDWFLDDVLIGSYDTLQVNMNASLQKITAKINYENGVVKTKSMLVSGYNMLKNIEDFSVFETQSESVTSRDFNLRVIVTKLNNTYRSDLADNLLSKVHISDVVYYGLNDAGKAVYKVTGILNCKERKVGSTVDVELDVKFIFGIEIP